MQHSTASKKYFTAIKLFWHFGQAIINAYLDNDGEVAH